MRSVDNSDNYPQNASMEIASLNASRGLGIAMLFFALVLATCLFGQIMIEEKLDYGGIERTFLTYIPAVHIRSLLLVFHGHAIDAQTMMNGYGLKNKADSDGTIVVCVDGVPNAGPNWILDVRSWNAYHCCGNSFETQVDDVGFVNYLID